MRILTARRYERRRQSDTNETGSLFRFRTLPEAGRHAPRRSIRHLRSPVPDLASQARGVMRRKVDGGRSPRNMQL